MSLIKCDECGKEISDKALYCVHCGNPICCEEEYDDECECDDCDCCKLQINDEKRNVRKFTFFCMIFSLPTIFMVAGFICLFCEGIFDMYENEGFYGFVCGIMLMVWILISRRMGRYIYKLVS